MPGATEAQVRARVGRIGFSGERAMIPVSSLSGGEKARVALGLAAFEKSHLLILDEPTNHLDIDSRDRLVEAVNEFSGAVVLVSHDRHLIEACVDQLWLVADGGVVPFDGDLDDYRRFIMAREENVTKDRAAKSGKSEAEAPAAESAADLEIRKKVTDLEAKIAKLERDIAKFDADLSEMSSGADAWKSAGITKKRNEAAKQLAAAEEEWIDTNNLFEARQAG
jgi:ATP-binding cassette subfamily F protein 3